MRITLVTTLALTLAGALAAPASAAVNPDAAGRPVISAATAALGDQPVVTDATMPGNRSQLMGREDFNDMMSRIEIRGGQSPLSTALPESASLALLLAGAWLLSAKRREAAHKDWAPDSYDY